MSPGNDFGAKRILWVGGGGCSPLFFFLINFFACRRPQGQGRHRLQKKRVNAAAVPLAGAVFLFFYDMGGGDF